MNFQGGFSKAYNEQGVEKFYTKEGSNYSNPHRYDIERLLRKKLGQKNQWISANSKILDLACGSGQVTTPLLSYGYKNIRGTDPYTFQAFKKQTKLECDNFSFMDILNDCYEGQKFDCIICSYAMHLVKETLLHDFCNKLSELSKSLIIIAPHKLPVMKQTYGWKEDHAFVLDKIHFRAFFSYNFEGQQGKKEEEGQQKKEENGKQEIEEN